MKVYHDAGVSPFAGLTAPASASTDADSLCAFFVFQNTIDSVAYHSCGFTTSR